MGLRKNYQLKVSVDKTLREYKDGGFIMIEAGLMVQSATLTMDLGGTGSVTGLTVTAPNGKQISYGEKGALEDAVGLALNGKWSLEMEIEQEEYFKEWTIDFELTSMTPISDYGLTTTIIGDGSVFDKDDPSTYSQSGQSRLGPMGGRSWGVAFDSNRTLYYNSFDQGFVARLQAESPRNELLSSNLTGINPSNFQFADFSSKINHIYEGDGPSLEGRDSPSLGGREGLSMPMVMDFDDRDNLYIAEYGKNRIVKLINPGSASSEVWKMEVVLDSDIIKQPMAARFDIMKSRILYVCDTGHHRILAYNLDTKRYKVVAGTGQQGYMDSEKIATQSPLNYPIDMDVNEYGIMVIAGGMSNRLHAVNMSKDFHIIAGQAVGPGCMKTIAGTGETCSNAQNPFDTCKTDLKGDGGKAIDAVMNWPYAPRFDSRGRIWFIDADNHRIRMIENFGYIYAVGGDSPLPESRGMRYVGSKGLDIGDGNSPLNADFNRPMDMALVEREDGMFNIIVGDTDNNVIRMISGVEMYNHKGILMSGRHTDLRIMELDEGIILNGKLGFKSFLKNFGNIPAPGDMIGGLTNMFLLTTVNNKPLRAGFKGPTNLANNAMDKKDIPDQTFDLPSPQNLFTRTIPGGVDIYPAKINASVDVGGISDGVYNYYMISDPYGYYFFTEKLGSIYGIQIEIYTENGNRKVKKVKDNIPLSRESETVSKPTFNAWIWIIGFSIIAVLVYVFFYM